MRVVLFYLTLLASQGVLSVLMTPLPAPDFFALVVLSLLWRVRAWQLVLVAYGVGLLQDAIGHGILGVHALGLAAAVLTATFLRSQITQIGALERVVVVAVALMGKWAIFSLMLLWMNESSHVGSALLRVALPEILITVFLSPFILSITDALYSRNRVFAKELL